MTDVKKKDSFEQDLERLETVVEALEEGGLSLEDALKQFEEGIKLSRRCEKTLTQAEKKIEILLKNASGELTTEPFDEEKPQATKKKPSPRKKAPEMTPPASPSSRDPYEDLPPEEEDEDELLF